MHYHVRPQAPALRVAAWREEPKCAKMSQNGLTRAQSESKWLKTGPYCQNRSKWLKIDPKWLKMAKKGSK